MSEKVRFTVGTDGRTVAEVPFEGQVRRVDLGVMPELEGAKPEPTRFDRKVGIVENFRRGRRWGRGK